MTHDLQVRYDGDDLEREELDRTERHVRQCPHKKLCSLTIDTQNKKGVVAISANRV